MKKFYFLATLLFLGLSSFSQVNYWGAPFDSLQMTVCPFDSTVSYMNCKDWEAYQTLNDEWDGPVDSSYCIPIGIKPLSNSGIIAPGTYDVNRRVFIRNKALDSNSVILQSNLLFEAYVNFVNNVNPYDTSCGGKPCNSFIAEIEVPDSLGNSFNYRRYLGVKDPNLFRATTSCIPVEKFSHNRLSNFVLILKVLDTAVNIRMSSAVVEYRFDAMNLDSTNLWQYRYNKEYKLQYGAHMLLHQSSSYPSSNGVSFHDLTPSVNTTTPDTVKLIIEPFASINYQAYTQFRAGTVVGSSQRHHLVTEIIGGNMCLPPFHDVIIFPGDEFQFTSGDIRFGNDQACMMLQGGSKMSITQNATFHYGLLGSGLLALRPGCEIEFMEGSHLLFDGHMMINPKGENPDSILVHLEKGQTLEFTSTAKISSPASSKLVVLNYGGEVLLDPLKEKYKQWVKVVDVQEEIHKMDFEVIQNPVEEHLFLSVRSPLNQMGNLTLFNLSGAPVYRQNMAFEAGSKEHSIDLQALENGFYVLKIESNGALFTSKILKL